MTTTTGIMQVKLNGVLYASDEGASLKYGGVRRESKMYGLKHNYFEAPVNSEITARFELGEGLDIGDFREFREGVVTFEADNGLVFLISSAYADVESLKLVGDDLVECTFRGSPAEQL